MTGDHTTINNDRFWRMKFVHDSYDVTGPARSPEGRAHYDGQKALYLSATPEGCIIASKRYLSASDPPRAIYPLRIADARVIDLRNRAACMRLGIDPSLRAVEWQSLRAQGLRSPTWDISDRVRTLGFDGMLYASRTDPAKTHLTLFNWNAPAGAQVRRDGAPIPFDMPVHDT